MKLFHAERRILEEGNKRASSDYKTPRIGPQRPTPVHYQVKQEWKNPPF